MFKNSMSNIFENVLEFCAFWVVNGYLVSNTKSKKKWALYSYLSA